MNVLAKVTWKAMWKNRTRTLVVLIGIVLSAAMFSAVTTMGVSLRDYLIRGTIYSSGDYFIRYDYATDAQADALAREESVTQVADYQAMGYVKTDGESENQMNCFVYAAGDDTFFTAMQPHLIAGRYPQSSGEVLLQEAVAKVLGAEVGETLTLDVTTEYGGKSDYDAFADNAAARTFSVRCTVSGIAEDHYWDDDDLCRFSILTYADGAQERAMWHRLFAKTAPASAARELPFQYGVTRSCNERLLAYYGATMYTNYNTLIVRACAVLISIIVIGSVSLIGSAFSVSVSERTKQFGLLCSIGATGRQLRRSVFFEAMVLCAFAVPVGLLCGYVGIAITLHLLGNNLAVFFASGNVTFRAVLSWVSLAAAALIATLTVFISAWIPARRATRITPIDAIRQSGDYTVSTKAGRGGRASGKLLGVPGLLAGKYYRTSRKKYRATVVSLTISVLLFVCASCFAQELQGIVKRNVNTQNFDIVCTAREDVRALSSVERAAYVDDRFYVAPAADTDLTEDYRAHCSEMTGEAPEAVQVHVFYLEDAVLAAYLREKGIDPAPYFSAEQPTALVCRRRVTGYFTENENGEWNRYTSEFDTFSDKADALICFGNGIPQALLTETEGEWPDYSRSAGGELLLTFRRQQKAYVLRTETDANGMNVDAYYPYDMQNGTVAGTPAYTAQADSISVRIGARITELPFGIRQDAITDSHYTALILPLSALGDDAQPQLYMTASDRSALRAYLEAERLDFVDYRADEDNSRSLLLVVRVFTYGFTVLISLIAAANVFNTISTNLTLRRRDFGVLRSVGMQRGQMRRMVNLECLSYGIKSLLIGLPMGLVLSMGIYKSMSGVDSAGYQLPWRIFAVAVLSVFAVVLASILYAMAKLRKNTPIEDIRMDSI